MKKYSGFSLVELLVGFGLFAVLLGTANVLLFSALRGARKAEAVGVAKAEGAYALNAMTAMIKFARSISCQGGMNANRLNVIRPNNDSFYYDYSVSRIASVSATTVDLTSARVVVRLCTGWPTVFRCDAAASTRSVSICFSTDLAGTPIPGEAGAVDFQTQVVLRNFGI